MAISFQYQVPSGQAKRRRTQRKYKMPNLEQQQRHAQRMAELEASALGRRGAAGGGALGGRVINPVADPRSTGLVAKHKAGGAPDVVEDATAPSSGVVEAPVVPPDEDESTEPKSGGWMWADPAPIGKRIRKYATKAGWRFKPK